MKNFVQPGKILDFVADRDYASGEPAVIGGYDSDNAGLEYSLAGGVFGIVQGAVANGERGSLGRYGVYEIAKAESEAIPAFAPLYFDEVSKTVSAQAGGRKVAIATEAAASGSGNNTVRALLMPEVDGGSGNLINEFTSAGAVTSGSPVMFSKGSLSKVVIPLATAGAATPVPALIGGPAYGPKAAVAIAQYDIIYWNDLTLAFTNVTPPAGVIAGYALKSALAGDSHVQLYLSPEFSATI